MLRSEPALRRVATDASVDASAKAGLVTEIFGGKVDQASPRPASARRSAVGGPRPATWPTPLEHLGEVAVVRSAGDDSGRLADELFAFGQAVNDNPGLRDALSDPSRSVGGQVRSWCTRSSTARRSRRR